MPVQPIERQLSGTPYYQGIATYGVAERFFSEPKKEMLTYFPTIKGGLADTLNPLYGGRKKVPERNPLYGEKNGDRQLIVAPLDKMHSSDSRHRPLRVYVSGTTEGERVDIALRLQDWGIPNEFALRFLASRDVQEYLRANKLKIDAKPQGRVYVVEFFSA